MEKRFILFIILSFLLMLFYPYFIEKLGLIPQTQSPRQGEPPAQKEDEKIQKKAPPASSQKAAPATSAATEEIIMVETALYRATFSSRGGLLVRWELKNYTNKDGTKRIVLYEARPGVAPAFSIQTADAELDQRLIQGLYGVEGKSLALDATEKTGQIAFHYQDPPTGARVAKRFIFSSDDYRVVASIETTGISDRYSFSIGNDSGITDWGTAGGFAGFIGPVTYLGDEMIKDNPSKIERPVRHEGRIVWTALQDKYFIAAAVPDAAAAAIVSRSGPVDINTSVEFTQKGPGPAAHRLLLYIGPKEHDRLKALGVQLEKTVDFGWFIYGSWAIVRFLAEPLFYILRFFHGFIGNYGVAIILLTVGVRVLFIPLTHKSYRSMKQMQVLQPQLQVLQKKHKDDRPRLQKEMMGLYQKNKVNPLGGCLPMLLQIPVFVALFNVLYTTIELRQASFVFWIRDLSDKDPYYVLPVLMGLTMVIQQKMQPTTMDPMQARMMLLLPVVMSGLFLSFPSGLVLYMLTNNILTIGQQYFTMKYFEMPHEKDPGKTPAAPRDRP